MDVAEEFILPRGLITDCHGDHLRAAHEIIEIISSVGAYHHVRGRKAVRHADLRGGRILFSLEDTAVIGPVPEIVYRCRPADIVSQAEIDAVEKVVRTVNIYSVVNNMRLSIRHIFPTWQVGVKSLFFHFLSSFPFKK